MKTINQLEDKNIPTQNRVFLIGMTVAVVAVLVAHFVFGLPFSVN